MQLQQKPTATTSTIPTRQQSVSLVRNLLGTTIGAITYLVMNLESFNFYSETSFQRRTFVILN